MSAALRVRVLGPFEVEGMAAHDFGSRKARTLLKMLALARDRPVPVDRIIEHLWPDERPNKPEEQVSVLVSRLRRRLGADRLPRTDAGYRLVTDWLDLDVATDLVEEGESRLGIGSWRQAHAASRAALELLRGPVLEDEPDARWADEDRRVTDRLLARAHRVAARAALALGDHNAAADQAAGALDLDPFDEDALRLLMAAHAQAGRPGSALRAYTELRERLGDELGIGPDATTEAVHDAIVTDAPVPTELLGIPKRTALRRLMLPGRQQDLAVLDAALDRVTRGGLEVLTVVAEAGMGRTALLSAWSNSLSDRATIISGRPRHPDEELPLQVVLDGLASCVASLPDHDLDGKLGADIELLGPLLGRNSADQRLPAPVDVDASRARLYTALTDVVQRLAEELPVVLAIDDAHLADEASISWLDFLTRRAAPSTPLLVLLTVAAGRHDLGLPGRVHVLEPLDAAAAAEIVGATRAEELHELTGGNPLYLTELADAPSEDELPASLTEAVASRCRRIGDVTTLPTAAVLGREIDLELLARVLRRHPADLLDELEEGVEQGILAEQGTGFAFRHELVRGALADSVSSPRRALAHREAAAALAARPASQPMAIAWHARLGGDLDRAASALLAASSAAEQRADYATAATAADDAVTLCDDLRSRLHAARALIAVADHRRAAEHATVALRMGGGAAAMELAGWAAYYQRDFAAARRLAADGARLADDDAVRASCITLEGRVRHADGDLSGARDDLTSALEVARGPTAIVASVWLGCVRSHQGAADESLELLGPGTRPGGAEAHPFAPLHALMFTAYGFGLVGLASDALAALDELDREVDRRDATRFAGRSQNLRGWILRNIGAMDEAADLHRSAIEAATAVDGTEAHGHGLLDLVEVALSRGDLADASARLDQVDPLLRIPHVFAWRLELRARWLRARLSLADGLTQDARAQALDLEDDSRRLGVRRYEVLAKWIAFCAAAHEGEPVTGEIDGLVGALDTVAGLESWWLLAELGASTNTIELVRRGEDRIVRLAEKLDASSRSGFERAAAARLESMIGI